MAGFTARYFGGCLICLRKCPLALAVGMWRAVDPFSQKTFSISVCRCTNCTSPNCLFSLADSSPYRPCCVFCEVYWQLTNDIMGYLCWFSSCIYIYMTWGKISKWQSIESVQFALAGLLSVFLRLPLSSEILPALFAIRNSQKLWQTKGKQLFWTRLLFLAVSGGSLPQLGGATRCFSPLSLGHYVVLVTHASHAKLFLFHLFSHRVMGLASVFVIERELFISSWTSPLADWNICGELRLPLHFCTLSGERRRLCHAMRSPFPEETLHCQVATAPHLEKLVWGVHYSSHTNMV